MIRRTTVLAGTFTLIFCGLRADAQTTARPRTGAVVAAPANPQPAQPAAVVGIPRTHVVRTGPAPRIALIAPPPQQVQPQYYSPPTAGWNTNAPQVAAFYYVPAVILTDGRVFANFNGSYEQVLRRCPAVSGPLPPGFATPTCWMVDTYGRYVVVQQR